MKVPLTLQTLQTAAVHFSHIESEHNEPSLYGATDGKAIGTHLEHTFKNFLREKYIFDSGNSASGIDLPELNVDIKSTSLEKPQSSCPFQSARQKIFGLGYSLLVFVYKKEDNPQTKASRLHILHTIFIDKTRTADYQLTSSLRFMLNNNANKDDIIALLLDRNLPIDDIAADSLAEEILSHPPNIGYLTISNALQWRLQYSRVIAEAGTVDGITRLA